MSFSARFGFIVAALAAFCSNAASQSATALPFAVGERLVYEGRVRGIGGHGTMWIAGPVEVRGVSTYELHFDFSARVGPLTVSQKSASWVDPGRMAALRSRSANVTSSCGGRNRWTGCTAWCTPFQA